MTRVSLLLGLIVAATLVVAATIRDAREASSPDASVTLPSRGPRPELVEGLGLGTSREALSHTVSNLSKRIADHPDDGDAVVRLAGALIRVQRVNNDGRAVITAEDHLRTFLARRPTHYDAQRTLAAVLLSQHRFADAIAQANKTSARDPLDPWNYGAMGDGYLELGDYDRAFEAFDKMGQLKPGPPVYARVAYAFELKCDLDSALEYMKRAADGTTPNDEEAQAWSYSQLGLIHLQRGRLGDAKREFERAAATFPGHPLAMDGLARIKIAEGDLSGARQIYQEQLARTPTPDLAAVVGDLMDATGDASAANRYYQMSEQIELAAWGNGLRQPQVLARFLTERGRDLDRALALAQEAAASRHDIFTMDTLAWAYFKHGRIPDALDASHQAIRTGTCDARVLYHAAEIAAASGDLAAARSALGRITSPSTVTDLHVRDGLKALREQLSTFTRTIFPPTAPARRH